MAELSELKHQAASLSAEADALRERLNITSREAKLSEVEAIAEDPNLWDDSDTAQQIMSEMARRRNELQPWRRLASLAEDSVVLAELAEEANDTDSAEEIERALTEMRELLSRLQTEALFADKYDAGNAILEINAGAGGTESCDWAGMLGRMYLRWCERHGFQADVMDSLSGDQAGIKSMTIEIQGTNAYGYLRSEHGIHRLVRISPFDAQNRRHTSFSSVDVIPLVDDEIDIEIRDEDLRVDTYRASGAGGQHVNKTESAIRLTHIPTGTVVTCQNERSQIKNRASAMRVLKSRLMEIQRKEQEAALAKLRGVQTDIAWGNQIRSYVLQPYTMVKDHRTDHETGNAGNVLDGDIDEFMVAFLQMLSSQRAELE
ncbi:MAG TPA: peptide chain release factor 2 [Armatimonadota bacterium]